MTQQPEQVPQPEYIGKDGRSHFRVTGGNCACGWSIMHELEWKQHLKQERAKPKGDELIEVLRHAGVKQRRPR
jgi:hypothetical protein